ncbi:MAG TPA: sigma 54-interacting transcriptional regulator [Methylococcaceae bacterium]|nr:sigma 54-interacting transcriptional regulator [Methylococcaceae bacterium]
MSQSSPFFNRWLSQVGPDMAIEVLSDLVDVGAVFAVDAAGKILFWSRGAERMSGLPAERAVGTPCTEAFGCEEGIDLCGLAEQGVIKGQSVTLKLRGGAGIACYRTARAFFDAEGRFAGAIEFLRPESQTAPAAAVPEDAERFHGILSRDPAMKEAIRIIRNVAETEATVLIRGESGTGKELVARALHLESHRRDAPFLAVNCAALTPSLLESELFGHVKGAFTGAVRDHAGLFQRAHGGTLFLDEVAELPLELQAKLLRVLQERTFLPVGSDHAVTVDVRIIAATHRSLREAVKTGRFREDLMYRLRVVPIFLPPLRERRRDVAFLLWHYIDRHNLQGPRRIKSIAPEAMRRLLDYPWPGNVRELQNVIEYAFAVGRVGELTLEDLPPEFHETAAQPVAEEREPVQRARRSDEAEMIREALQVSGGYLENAARLAGMSRATFWRKRKKYGI